MYGTAMVIGGSMAGLLAAQVLAEHFTQVTIVERDRFPDGPEARKGVPQARHSHLLLLQGKRILDQLFPGFSDEMISAGAIELRWPADIRWLGRSGWGPRFPSDFLTYTCSRDLLDYHVRQRLIAHPRIQFRIAADVGGLLADTNKTHITGVQVQSRDHTDATPEELHADFVVDASGRDSQAPQWLVQLGYPETAEETINASICYASRSYARPDNVETDWQCLIVQSRPPEMVRGGVIFPLEGNRWIVSLAGTTNERPPTDEAGFLAFARSLLDPSLYNAIKDAQPLSPISGYQRMENRLRHYEKLARWPERFVALGDAVCAFNPVYGQGLTTAGQAALVLDACLRGTRTGTLDGLARRFQQRLARANATPWLMATGEDLRYNGVVGGAPNRLTRVMQRYTDQVLVLASERPDVYASFNDVMHMVASPNVLFSPGIVASVIKRSLQKS